LAAAKKMKIKQVPVKYQDFDSDEQEYAFGISDNSISAWAELDLSGINLDIVDLGPELDLNLLGIKDFVLDMAEKEEDPEPEKFMVSPLLIECPHCEKEFEEKQARTRRL